MDKLTALQEIHRFLEVSYSKLGALSTVYNDAPQTVFVYFAVDEENNIYFATRADSRKYTNIMSNPKVSFAVVSEDLLGTVQLEGKAEIVTDPDLQRTLFSKLKSLGDNRQDTLPVNQYSTTGEMIYFKIVPTWARLSDFKEKGTSPVFHEVTF